MSAGGMTPDEAARAARILMAAPALIAALDRLVVVADLLGADRDKGGALWQALSALAAAGGYSARRENVVEGHAAVADVVGRVARPEAAESEISEVDAKACVLAKAGGGDDALKLPGLVQDADAAVLDAAPVGVVHFVIEVGGDVSVARGRGDVVEGACVHLELSGDDRVLLGYTAKYLAKVADRQGLAV